MRDGKLPRSNRNFVGSCGTWKINLEVFPAFLDGLKEIQLRKKGHGNEPEVVNLSSKVI